MAQSGAFLTYVARCQYLLQQGLFVGDVLYYNGDGAPEFVEVKHVDPSLGPRLRLRRVQRRGAADAHVGHERTDRVAQTE